MGAPNATPVPADDSAADDQEDLTKHPAYALGVKHAYDGTAPNPTATPAPPPLLTPPSGGASAVASRASAYNTSPALPQLSRTAPIPPRVPPPAAPIGPAWPSSRGTSPSEPQVVNNRVLNAGVPPGNDMNVNTGVLVPKDQPGFASTKKGVAPQPINSNGAGPALPMMSGAGALPRTQAAGPTPPVGGQVAVGIPRVARQTAVQNPKSSWYNQ
jgi:hypothetical protein